MKTFISTENFQKVLELLGLPDDTLHIEIGGRARASNGNTGMLMTGVDSTWGMKAVIAVPGSYDHENHRNLEPYSTRTVYVPVLLPSDWLGHLATAEPIPYPLVTSQPSSVPPETPFAVANSEAFS